ncbi:MAG TPA: GYF domain-containing protein [Polyangia bacterium]|nr:GYF domain-containing protein [Polyangia bacterium]
MKIVCDNCATKYSIADEKVRGKVFKIRCKKCSHIIVVRGGADGNVEASSRDAAPAADAGFPGEDQQTIAARAGTPAAGVPAAGASGDAVWHLVIDREQVGPLAPAEVRQKFSNGEIDVETYAWREGFGDWLRLGSIEDFRDLGAGAPARDEGATRRTDSADLFAGAGGGGDDAPAEAPSGDLFGGAAAAAAPAYSSAPAPAAEADVFGGGGGGGGLFGAPSAAPAPRATRTSSPGFAAASAAPAAHADEGGGGGVDVRPMTGQRNENSVLFSLNNLQALATGGGGAKASAAAEQRPGFANSQTEGSGLIDIRAMAASTLAASPSSPGPSMGGKGEELPGLGSAPVFSPMAAPILMPAAPSGPPKWMFAILGVGVLAVLGIVVVGILLLTRKPAEPQVAAAPAAAQPGTAVAAAGTHPAATAPAATAPAAAAGTPAAGTPSAPVAQNDKEEKKHAAKGSSSKEHGTKLAKAETAPAKAEAPAAKAEAPAAPAPKKGKHDALDDLLNDASPESKPAAAKKERPAAREESGGDDSSLPSELDKGQIVSGMQRIKGRVGGCFDQYKVPGMANVAVTIAGSGRVSSANVTGQFAGTPTGDCVAKAVKSASFPKFKGSPQSIVYPFILR